MAYEAELEAARRAAERAAARVRELYRDFVAIPDAPIDISTQADRDAQEIILRALREAFPDDAYRAEEATPTLAACRRQGPRMWVIDPIDGTRGFAQKNGEFSIMVALAVEGTAVVGVVHEPAVGRLTWAVRGGGCWRREGEMDVPCRVSAQGDLTAAALTQSHSRQPGPSRLAVALGVADLHQTHSAGVKLARVARGAADLYVNDYPKFNDWDICAGHVLVEEAGGRVTGLGGEEVRYGGPTPQQRQGLLASNGRLHALAVARLAAVPL